MATLKREVKKLPSEQNLRLLSSLIVSLANKQSSLEDKCIAPWKSGETYQANISYVSNLGYVWLCKTTNNDVDFSESKWIKMADDINEVTEQQVRDWIGLSSEQIDTLSKIILDSEVRLDKTWSSSRVYSSIQDAIDTSKAYTLAELGKASGASYRVVSSTGDMTEQKYIYLMSDGSGSYNMYIVEDNGSATQIGNTTISLDDYFTKTEITDNYYDKSTSDGKFATITTVDDKVDKTSIATAISSTPSDEKVLSEKAVKTELDKKIDSGVRLDLNKLSNNDRFSILEWIDSTNSKTYSAMQIANDGSVKIKLQFNEDDGIINIFKNDSTTNNTWKWLYRYVTSDCVERSNGEWTAIQNNLKDGTTSYRLQLEGSGGVSIYETLDKWATINSRKSVCTTKVNDVPVTDVTFTNSKVSKSDSYETCQYCVKNGICYVTLNGLAFSSSYVSNEDFVTLPKPAMRQDFTLTDSFGTNVLGKLFLELHGGMHLYTNTTPVTNTGFISFSYPVAESWNPS